MQGLGWELAVGHRGVLDKMLDTSSRRTCVLYWINTDLA